MIFRDDILSVSTKSAVCEGGGSLQNSIMYIRKDGKIRISYPVRNQASRALSTLVLFVMFVKLVCLFSEDNKLSEEIESLAK